MFDFRIDRCVGNGREITAPAWIIGHLSIGRSNKSVVLVKKAIPNGTLKKLDNIYNKGEKHDQKEDKSEFIGQIMDLFEDFLDEYGIKIPQKEGEEGYDPDTPINLYGKTYDDLAEQLEGFFRGWGVIKDERPQVEYLFILSLNGIKCEGTISVKAKDSDEAYRKAQDLAETELSSSFPSLDIPYDVEPVEEEGYPLYSIITEFLPFSTEQKVVSTSDKADADALFEKACRDNSAVKLTVQTSSKASPAILKKWSI